MKWFKLCYHVAIVSVCTLSIISNFYLNKEVQRLRIGVHSAHMISTDNSMTIETALQTLSSEGPREVERISRKIAKEEVIKGFQKFNENFQKLSEEKKE